MEHTCGHRATVRERSWCVSMEPLMLLVEGARFRPEPCPRLLLLAADIRIAGAENAGSVASSYDGQLHSAAATESDSVRFPAGDPRPARGGVHGRGGRNPLPGRRSE